MLVNDGPEECKGDIWFVFINILVLFEVVENV
jgi:hypothetical protein